jgi:hypothetical protein
MAVQIFEVRINSAYLINNNNNVKRFATNKIRTRVGFPRTTTFAPDRHASLLVTCLL